MKDHDKAALVNELTALAKEFAGSQQLRERIAHCVLAALERAVTDEREACAQAAEGFTDGRDDRKWIPGSLYDTLRRETAASIRQRAQAKGGTQ